MCRQYLVDSVQEFVCRLRPLCEWIAFDRDHFSTTEWLVSIIDTLAEFRRENPGLVRKCQPVVRRFVQGDLKLQHWLQSGNAAMALHRAQFLPLGHSGLMHRFVCPSQTAVASEVYV